MTIVQAHDVVAGAINQLVGAGYYPQQIADYTNATKGDDGTINDGVKPDLTPLTGEQIGAMNLAALNDLGEIAGGSPAGRDLVFDSLCDMIGKVVVEARRFTADIPDVYYDMREFGGVLEWIKMGLAPILDDPMWQAASKGGYINYQDTYGTPTEHPGHDYGSKLAAMEHGFYKTKVQAKTYQKAHAFMAVISKAKEQMFTGFRSWEEAQAFFTGIEMTLDKTLRLKSKILAQALISGGICTALALGHAVNLVQVAHDMYDSNITTAAAFLADRRAQEYALNEIANVLDQFQEFSIAYNDRVLPSFATKEDTKLILISKYQNLLKYTVKSDTYNAEQLGLPTEPQRLTAWQGIFDGSNQFGWNACTAVYIDAATIADYAAAGITITPNADPETPGGTDYTTFTQSGIVGFAYDKPGCCMALEKVKSTWSYTAVTDHLNEFHHYLGQQVINPAYNMCVFLVQDLP